ncbi:tetratricopeptide repeat protein [Planctomicrobium sp. SH668]|uniref:tetratricopeptide repeat protein n=1 Tax=Planctomicrobium sp. SH668 TaxID=3448126 RepID=UPI003F5B6BC1
MKWFAVIPFLFSIAATPAIGAEGVISPPQRFIVSKDSAPLMIGDDLSKTVPLGTVLSAIRKNANWRYSPDQKGWIHLRDLVPVQSAVEEFTQQIEKDPSPRSYQLRGIAWMTQEAWENAISDFEKAYELGESSVALHLNLGACYSRIGDVAQAISEYDAILNAYANDFSASIARGNLLIQQGQFKAALRDFEAALTTDAHSAEAHHCRGIALRMLGRYEDAILAYNRAIEVDGTRADSLGNRAYTHKEMGNYDNAKRDYEAALAIAPDSIPIQNDLAWMLATCPDSKFRNPQRAIQLAEAFCQETKYSDAEYLDTLAAAYASQNRFPEAIEAARLALTTLGENPAVTEVQAHLDLYLQQKPFIDAQSKVVAPAEETAPAAEEQPVKEQPKSEIPEEKAPLIVPEQPNEAS